MLFVLVALNLIPAIPLHGAAFEGDYEVNTRHHAVPGIDMAAMAPMPDSELKHRNEGMDQLPLPLDPHEREKLFESQHEIALLTDSPPVPGAPAITYVPKPTGLSANAVARPMCPNPDDAFDEDCDSPQLGEVEPFPITGGDVHMNSLQSNVTLPEQDDSSREVLMDAVTYNPIPKDRVNQTTTQIPSDGKDYTGTLPPPDKAEAAKNKCSRNTNGLDTPDPLADLGEDCGMPEPIIPCETAGNSSKCEPPMYLKAPPVPIAEKMPPIPAPPAIAESETLEVSVEFVDFGRSVTLNMSKLASLSRVITTAGAEIQVEEWHIQMIRSAGAQISTDRLLYTLEDPHQLVVYLLCTPRIYLQSLIVKLPACEDLVVVPMEVRVEVPETDDVFVVHVMSNQAVEAVLKLTPVPLHTVSKVTYNGARVLLNQTLNYIHFANKSAVVVYLSPLSAINRLTVKTSNTSSTSSTNAGASGSGFPITDANRPLVPVPDTQDDDFRVPMTDPAVVTLHFEDRNYLDFPVLVTPTDVGMVLYEALKDRTGKPFKQFNLFFRRQKIEQATALKPLGLLTRDLVLVQMLPA